MMGNNLLPNRTSLLFPFMTLSKRCPQGPKTAMQVVTNHMRGFTQPASDLFRGQSFVIRHLQNRPLTRLQLFQHLLSETHDFG